MSYVVILSFLLVAPAWACDMGGLLIAIAFAIAIGAAICSLVSALLAWAMRPTPLANPVRTLCFSILAGTAAGTAAGIFVGASMPYGFQFLWGVSLVSIVVSSAIVSRASGVVKGSMLKTDEPVPGLLEAPASTQEHVSEWKTLS